MYICKQAHAYTHPHTSTQREACIHARTNRHTQMEPQPENHPFYQMKLPQNRPSENQAHLIPHDFQHHPERSSRT